MIGKRILHLRKENGLSQEELAAKLTVSRQAISKWELSESVPDTENIVQLSQLFGVSTDFLLLDETSVKPLPAKQKKPPKKVGEQIKLFLLIILATALLIIIIVQNINPLPIEQPWPHGSFVDRDQAAHGALHLVFESGLGVFIIYRQTTDEGDWAGEMLEDYGRAETVDIGSFSPVSRRDGVFRIMRENEPTLELIYTNDRIYWPNGDGTFTVFFRFSDTPTYINIRSPWFGDWYEEFEEYEPQ